MANRNLDDLLWSVDRTVRSVLNSQEMENLGKDIKNSLRRAGEEVKPIIDNVEDAVFSGSRRTNTRPDGWEQSAGQRKKYTDFVRKTPTNWKTPSRSQRWNSSASQSTDRGYRGKIVHREPKWHRGGSVLMTVFGYLGTGFFGLISLGMLLSMLVETYSRSLMGGSIASGVLCAGCLAIGVVGTVCLAGKNQMRKIWKYLKGRDFCKISEICDSLGFPNKQVVKSLEKMIDLKFLPEGHFDDTQTCLMLTDDIYTRYLESLQARREEEQRKKQMQEDPQQAALAKMVREGSEYIRRIREINNDLPDPVVSNKLDDLEKVCQQIFAYVADHPDKLSAIRKLMSYYLPTTLKLLEAYRKLVRQNTGVESEEKTEQEILAALDNINLAFHNLLDDLMENDYLDLSSDISVLQSMLAQEGLVDDFATNSNPTEKDTQPSAPKANFDGIELDLNPDSEKGYEPELHL